MREAMCKRHLIVSFDFKRSEKDGDIYEKIKYERIYGVYHIHFIKLNVHFHMKLNQLNSSECFIFLFPFSLRVYILLCLLSPYAFRFI